MTGFCRSDVVASIPPGEGHAGAFELMLVDFLVSMIAAAYEINLQTPDKIEDHKELLRHILFWWQVNLRQCIPSISSATISKQLQAVESVIASTSKALRGDQSEHYLAHAEDGEEFQHAIEHSRDLGVLVIGLIR
jgi:hypothetical protein